MQVMTGVGAAMPALDVAAGPRWAPGPTRAASGAAASGAAAPAATRPLIEVWVPDAGGGIDLLAQHTRGRRSRDPAVRQAYDSARRVLEYVRREFGRDGHDGRGAPLKLRVHAPDPTTGDRNANNAFWFNDEQRIWLGDGDGEYFAPLGGAADVVAHEFFHGVVDHEVRLAYVGQEGALHESFADVLATGVDGNWQIGEDVFTPAIPGDALRDLSRLTHTDWRTFPAGEDEVHAMSEVPSHAAFLMAKSLGAGEVRRIFYTALTDHLRNGAGFAGARDATLAAARALHGARSTQVQAVADAWAAVGVDATTPKGAAAAVADAAAAAASLGRPNPALALLHLG